MFAKTRKSTIDLNVKMHKFLNYCFVYKHMLCCLHKNLTRYILIRTPCWDEFNLQNKYLNISIVIISFYMNPCVVLKLSLFVPMFMSHLLTLYTLCFCHTVVVSNSYICVDNQIRSSPLHMVPQSSRLQTYLCMLVSGTMPLVNKNML